MLEVGLPCDQSFDDDIFDICPVLMGFEPESLEGLEKLCQRFFVPVAQVIDRLVEYIFRIVFVDGVVGEMHAEVIHILFVRVFIFLC